MASLTVLTDADVQKVLSHLTRDEVLSLQVSLRKALHEYSTSGDRNQPECVFNQLERLKMDHPNGNTTLFMPSKGSKGIGMKVVTLAAPKDSRDDEEEAREDLNVLSKAGKTPQGGLTLMHSNGKPFAFINAEELTAFRTALVSSLLMIRRQRVKCITVFGSGKQAWWHVRIALILFGKTIKRVNIINHRFSETSKAFFKRFFDEDAEIKETEGWTNTKFSMMAPEYHEYSRMEKEQVRDADIIICATPSQKPLFPHSILTSSNGRLKGRLIIAVGGFKTSMIEVPQELLRQAIKHHGPGIHVRKRAPEGGVILVDTIKAMGQTGEFDQADIPSTKVIEIGEIVSLEESFLHEHEDDSESAIDDTDTSPQSHSSLDLSDGRSSLRAALEGLDKEGGSGSRRSSRSGSRSGSFSRSLSRRSSVVFRRRKHSVDGHHTPGLVHKQSKDEKEMSEFLCRGNVIYKSIGLGLMDLVVGADIVDLANSKNIGTQIPNF